MADDASANIPIAKSDAPILYFDGAPNFGFANGIGNVTLEALRFADNNAGGVSAERVAVAHLRTSLQGIIALHQALGHVLLMAQKTEGQPN